MKKLGNAHHIFIFHLSSFIFHLSSFIFHLCPKALVAQLDRASAFEAEGSRFESVQAHDVVSNTERVPWICNE
jgi:hypothetical protein